MYLNTLKKIIQNKKTILLYIFFDFILGLLTLVCGMGIPYIYCDLIDSVQNPELYNKLKFCVMLYIVLNLASILLKTLAYYVQKIMEKDITKSVSLDYWDSCIKDRKRNNNIHIRLAFAEDIKVLSGYIHKYLVSAAICIVSIILYFVIMFGIQFGMTVILIGSTLLVNYVAKIINRNNQEYSKKDNEKYKEITEWLQLVLSRLKVIKIDMVGSSISSKYKELLKEKGVFLSKRLKIGFIVDILNFVSENFLNNMLIYIIGVIMVSKGRMTFGEIIIFVNYSKGLFSNVSKLNIMMNTIHMDKIQMDRVATKTEETNEDETHNLLKKFTFSNEIRFSNVRFKYLENSNRMLQISKIDIPKGKFIGIVGGSGEGKSTLAKLCGGLLIPLEGEILYDNERISDVLEKYNCDDLIGNISENSYVFNTSIKDNLLYAAPESSIDRLTYVCQLFNLNSNEISKTVGKNGCFLSGGERQKLLLARMYLCHKQIMILDEVTSALDQQTRERVKNVLEKEWNDSTRIVITHDNQLITEANTIYEVNNGIVKKR